MVEFNSLASRGGSDDYTVYMYNWEWPDSLDEEPVLDSLENFCDQIYEEEIITSYEIKQLDGVLKDDTKLTLEDDDNLDDLHDKFGEWVDDYVAQRGTHLAISNEVRGGLGNSALYSSQAQAFAAPRHATIGLSDIESEDRIANRTVHETLHTTVNNDLNGVDDMIGDVNCCSNKVNRDHYLGTLINSGTDASPLLGGYGTDVWSNGDCSVPESYDRVGYTTDLTDCEIAAVQNTYINDR